MSFETQNYLIFCMEYCNGGELFNLLRKVRRMKEPEAKFYFLETLAALTLLHSQKILYRDLKPENIIIDSEGHIRLADYGLSKIMKDDMTHSFCGSAEYMAPEMLLKYPISYSEKVIASKSITIVWERYFTSYFLVFLPITPEIKTNYLATSSPKNYSFPRTSKSPKI